MKPGLIIIAISVLLAGCGNIYFVRKTSVDAIHAEITRSPEKYAVRRVVLAGWIIEGFEMSRIYPDRSRKGSGIEVDGGIPWVDGNPFRHQYPYVYKQAKVRIEGTLLIFPRTTANPGIPDRDRLVLIDNIVKVLSPVEEIRFDQNEK